PSALRHPAPPLFPYTTLFRSAALAREHAPAGVLVDLGNPGLSVPDLLARLRAACPRMPRVVAYGSHVDAAGLRAARAAGCDVVLDRKSTRLNSSHLGISYAVF